MKTPTLTAVVLAVVVSGCSGGGGGGGGGAPTPSAGTIRLEEASYASSEGAGAVTIAAVRTGGSAGAVSVTYATSNGTATAGTDYGSASATLSWGDGEDGPRSFTVTIADDAGWEESETFGVSLQSPAGGAALGTPASAVVTIADDDPAGPGTLRWSSLSPWVDEGSGTKTITVLREGGSLGPVSVSYASGAGTATSDADYTPVSGTLSWGDGDAAAKSFDVPILDDSLPELYENVKLTLSAVTGGATIASNPEATLTIRNDDAELSFLATPTGTSEQGEAVVLYVQRVGATPTPVTVRCATGSGTATAGLDYEPSDITYTWAAGEVSSKMFFVVPKDDLVREGDEAVEVTLSSPAGAILGTPSSVLVTIADDEPPAAGHLAFTSDQFLAGNHGGTATISVARTGPTATGAVAVSYATLPGGNATEWVDYVPTSGLLSWADGEAGTKTFQVAIVDDLVADPADWVALALSTVTGGAELGPQRTSQIVIREHWTKDPNQPVLVPGASGSLDFMDVRAPSVVQLGPAEYVMFYEATGVTTAAPSGAMPRIGRAESTDGIAWKKWPDGPVLDAGAPGAFDEAGVGSPAVLFDGATWHMWYSSGTDGSVAGSRIGYATSSDGIAWTRQNGGSPVLAPLAATWDRNGVGMPAVVKEGATFSMWYVGTYLEPAIGRAQSTDGVTWTRAPAGPVLTKGAYGTWSGYGVFEPAVIKDGATYRMWLEGFSGSVQWIGYATSPDGTTWTQHSPNPVFTRGSDIYWDDAGVGGPTVVKNGERFELWYRGAGYDAPRAGVGRATLP